LGEKKTDSAGKVIKQRQQTGKESSLGTEGKQERERQRRREQASKETEKILKNTALKKLP